jgi:hypothetical protein
MYQSQRLGLSAGYDANRMRRTVTHAIAVGKTDHDL